MGKTIKSSEQAKEEIASLLVAGGILSVITGEIRTGSRMLGSTKEDIVISTLYWDADQFQNGRFNVNIHVSNLTGQPSGNPTSADTTQPNKARMEAIANIATPILDDYCGYDFTLRVVNNGKLEGDGTKWLYNMEVDYIHLRRDT